MRFPTGSKAGDYEELRERTYTKILGNGTLLLQHVKEDREGFYLCHASNGIGSGLGKVVQLKVNCEYMREDARFSRRDIPESANSVLPR